MEKWLIIVVIMSSIISLIGSAIVIVYVYKKKQRRDRENYSNSHIVDEHRRITKQNTQIKTWKFFTGLWLLLCLVFIGIILYQHNLGMDERVFDSFAVFVGLVFFAIAAINHRATIKRRILATVSVDATFVDKELRSNSDRYTPVYEIYAEGAVHRVSYPGGVTSRKKGDQVDAYYAPGNPKIVYIPGDEKSNYRFFIILYFIGIAGPVFGLLAPLFR